MCSARPRRREDGTVPSEVMKRAPPESPLCEEGSWQVRAVCRQKWVFPDELRREEVSGRLTARENGADLRVSRNLSDRSRS
jgi:hypothetical protein